MKKQLLLVVAFLGMIMSHNAEAAMGPWLKLGKHLTQACGGFYLSQKLLDLNEKKDIQKSDRYKYGFEKLLTMLGVGLFVSSFENDTTDMLEAFKRCALLATLVAGTHTVANNDRLTKQVRKLPLAGAVFTDAEDMHGNEQTSVGTITRYICVYMGLRYALKYATQNTRFSVAPYLMV